MPGTCPVGQEVEMEDNYREVKKAEPCLKLIHMDQVEVEEIEWLFYPFIPYGKVTIIQGDPGEGKTTVVLQIIAKLTKGEAILSETRDQMRDKFGLLLLSNFEDYPQEKSCELDSYYEKIYIALKAIDLEDSKEHTNDRYYITRKKYRTVNGKGFFEYTLSYAQEEITKFDRFGG